MQRFLVCTVSARNGVIPEKLGGSMRYSSWNPYPISDQDLWFSLPYLRPDQKSDTLFQTWSPRAPRVTRARDKLLHALKRKWSYRQMMKKWLILLKNTPNSRLECTNHTLFRTKTDKKNILFCAAHTYIAYLWDYPPPPGWKTRCRLWVLLLTEA